MFNKKYLSSKYARPSNIQLSSSELPTDLNNNAKLCFFTISANNRLIKYTKKIWMQKKLNKRFDLDNSKFSVT